MQLTNATDAIRIHKIESLSTEAFPACERKPFSLICQKQSQGLTDIFALEENGDFCGLAITMKAEDLVLLDYFAIVREKRGKGYGKMALEALFAHFNGKRFFLEIESTLAESANKSQLIKRKRFYLKNQLTELNLYANVFGTDMELLAYQTSLTFDEYIGVYKTVYGQEKAACIKRLP